MTGLQFDYNDAVCPMPDCGEPLVIEWTAAYGLSIGDLADSADLPRPEGAHTQGWDVRCHDGHVVLVPSSPGCGCDYPESPRCPHDPDDFDWSDESRSFRRVDLDRLRDLIRQLAPTPDPASAETGA